MPARPVASAVFLGGAAAWLGLLGGTTGAAEPVPMLDPQADYRAERRNAVTYEVDFSVVVTAPYKTKTLRVWLPLPPSDFAQEVSESTLSSFPLKVEPTVAAEPVFGNRFAYFEFASPAGAQLVRHRFKIKTYELVWNLEPRRVVPVAAWPASFEPYRRGETKAVVVDDRFKALVDEIVPRKGNPLDELGQVMRWTQDRFTYDHHAASLQASSTHALEKRRGHCSDYHGFCAAMGRALGYPTRVTYGINPFPKASPSHCKLEAFLPPYGWVSFDVSETQKLLAGIAADEKLSAAERTALAESARARLLGGFRDNTWYLQTRGTDYELAPPASRRAAVVRTAFVEADGVPLEEPDPSDPARTTFSWMTLHDYKADRKVPYPFAEAGTLAPTGR